jgi:hypothetical protein
MRGGGGGKPYASAGGNGVADKIAPKYTRSSAFTQFIEISVQETTYPSNSHMVLVKLCHVLKPTSARSQQRSESKITIYRIFLCDI